MPIEAMQGSKTIHIQAPPQALWSMASDIIRMGEWNPETRRAEWVGDAIGPVAGARFTGHNQRGPTK